jgi:hypothetical protein
MVTIEPVAGTASEPPPPGVRIRWGWFLGCLAAGLVAIVVGWAVTAPVGRVSYLTGVLANAGTTLLLVGIVVLLERRIVDSAVKRFRNAAEEARARMRADFRLEVRDFTDRVSTEWAAASPEDVEAMTERTRRLAKELADSYAAESVEAYDGDEGPDR